MLKFKLFHYWRSSSSWRVRWALSIKKIECDYIHVDLLKKEQVSIPYLKRNPLGFVPTLEVTDERGTTRFLSESTAIVEWLDEIHSTPALLPKDPWERARTRMISQVVNAGIQPIQNISVLQKISDDPEKKKEWAQYWIRKGFNAIEALLEEEKGNYCVGDSVTMADLCLEPQCYNAHRYEIDLSEFPSIERIHRNLTGTESYLKSHPDRFKS